MARQVEDFAMAVKWYSTSEKLISHWPIPLRKKLSFQIDALCGQAMSLRGQGEFSKAISYLRQAITGYKKLCDKAGVAYVLWAQGTTFRFMGNFISAEKTLRAALELYSQINDPSGLAYARAGLGGALRMRGLAKESGALYKMAHQYFSKVGDQFGLAYASCGQGNAFRMQNQLSKAKRWMDRAIALYIKLGQKGPQGFVLWSRAQVHILLGHFSLAKDDLRMAERLFKKVRDHRGLVYCDLGWGEFFRHQGDSRATRYFNQVLNKTKKSELRFERAHAYFLSSSSESENVLSLYRRFGIDRSHYRRYLSLP